MDTGLDLAMHAVNLGVTLGLVNALANSSHHPAQERAGHCLLTLAKMLPRVEDGLRAHWGDDMHDRFTRAPGAFFRGFSAEDVETLRFGHDALGRSSVLARAEEDEFERERETLEEQAREAGKRIDREEDERVAAIHQEVA
jgi:hypothetical protein